MKILHTADWHIGRTLYGKKRYTEFEHFLNWLFAIIQEQGIEALIVAGDVFDTTTPSNRSQELYYSFLCRVARTSCRHVVIVSGNHDSPSFLNAPRKLLKELNVHVIGEAAPLTAVSEEVLPLKDQNGATELIVCAVPYLRDRDVRSVDAGENIMDKEQKLVQGIAAHYEGVANIAAKWQAADGGHPPVIATGHLFTAGGETVDGDGVRELYIGSLAHVKSSIFPPLFAYVALGHLHVPQRVHGSEIIRYSGSPLPMGFGEAGQEKQVCIVEISATSAKEHATEVSCIPVPVFQKLERIRGDGSEIKRRLLELVKLGESIWVEIHYEGEEGPTTIKERVDAVVEGTAVEVLRIKNEKIRLNTLTRGLGAETLDDLTVADVFERCLTARGVAADQRADLNLCYQEVVAAIFAHDALAE